MLRDFWTKQNFFGVLVMIRRGVMSVWKVILLAIGSLVGVAGATTLGVYISGGLKEKFVEPQDIYFSQVVESPDKNADTLAYYVGSSSYSAEFKTSGDFMMTISSNTEDVTEKELQLSFEGTSITSGDYIEDGVIKVPKVAEIGKPFKVELVKAYNNTTHFDTVVGGNSILTAKSSNLLLDPISTKICVDVPVSDFYILPAGETKNAQNAYTVYSDTEFTVDEIFRPTNSKFLFSDTSASKLVFFDIQGENIAYSYQTQKFHAGQNGTGLVTAYTFSNSFYQRERLAQYGYTYEEMTPAIMENIKTTILADARLAANAKKYKSASITLQISSATIDSISFAPAGNKYNQTNERFDAYTNKYLRLTTNSTTVGDATFGVSVTATAGEANTGALLSYMGIKIAGDTNLSILGGRIAKVAANSVEFEDYSKTKSYAPTSEVIYYLLPNTAPQNYDNYFWQISSTEASVTPKALEINFFTKDESGAYTNYFTIDGFKVGLENDVEKTFNVLFKERENEEPPAWGDQDTISMLINYKQDGSIEPASKDLTKDIQKTDKWNENVYQEIRYFVFVDEKDVASILPANTDLSKYFVCSLSGEYTENYLDQTLIVNGTAARDTEKAYTLYEIPDGMLIAKESFTGEVKVFVATIQTKADGTPIMDGAKYKLVNTSYVRTVKVESTLSIKNIVSENTGVYLEGTKGDDFIANEFEYYIPATNEGVIKLKLHLKGAEDADKLLRAANIGNAEGGIYFTCVDEYGDETANYLTLENFARKTAGEPEGFAVFEGTFAINQQLFKPNLDILSLGKEIYIQLSYNNGKVVQSEILPLFVDGERVSTENGDVCHFNVYYPQPVEINWTSENVTDFYEGGVVDNGLSTINVDIKASGQTIAWGGKNLPEIGVEGSAVDQLNAWLVFTLKDQFGREIDQSSGEYQMKFVETAQTGLEKIINLSAEGNKIASFSSANSQSTMLEAYVYKDRKDKIYTYDESGNKTDNELVYNKQFNFVVKSEGVSFVGYDSSTLVGEQDYREAANMGAVTISKYITFDTSINNEISLGNLIKVYVGDLTYTDNPRWPIEAPVQNLHFYFDNTYISGLSSITTSTGDSAKESLLKMIEITGRIGENEVVKSTTDLTTIQEWIGIKVESLKFVCPFDQTTTIRFVAKDENESLFNITVDLVCMQDVYESNMIASKNEELGYSDYLVEKDNAISIFADKEYDLNEILPLYTANYPAGTNYKKTWRDMWGDAGVGQFYQTNSNIVEITHATESEHYYLKIDSCTTFTSADLTIYIRKTYYSFKISLKLYINPNIIAVTSEDIERPELDAKGVFGTSLSTYYNFYRATDYIESGASADELTITDWATTNTCDSKYLSLNLSEKQFRVGEDKTLILALGEKTNQDFAISENTTGVYGIRKYGSTIVKSDTNQLSLKFNLKYSGADNIFEEIVEKVQYKGNTYLVLVSNKEYKFKGSLTVYNNQTYGIVDAYHGGTQVEAVLNNSLISLDNNGFDMQETATDSDNKTLTIVSHINVIATATGDKFVYYNNGALPGSAGDMKFNYYNNATDFETLVAGYYAENQSHTTYGESGYTLLEEKNVCQELYAGQTYKIIHYSNNLDDDFAAGQVFGFYYDSSEIDDMYNIEVSIVEGAEGYIPGIVSYNSTTNEISIIHTESQIETYIVLRLSISKKNSTAAPVVWFYRIKVVPSFTLGNTNYPYAQDAEYLDKYSRDYYSGGTYIINFAESLTATNSKHNPEKLRIENVSLGFTYYVKPEDITFVAQSGEKYYSDSSCETEVGTLPKNKVLTFTDNNYSFEDGYTYYVKPESVKFLANSVAYYFDDGYIRQAGKTDANKEVQKSASEKYYFDITFDTNAEFSIKTASVNDEEISPENYSNYFEYNFVGEVLNITPIDDTTKLTVVVARTLSLGGKALIGGENTYVLRFNQSKDYIATVTKGGISLPQSDAKSFAATLKADEETTIFTIDLKEQAGAIQSDVSDFNAYVTKVPSGYFTFSFDQSNKTISIQTESSISQDKTFTIVVYTDTQIAFYIDLTIVGNYTITQEIMELNADSDYRNTLPFDQLLKIKDGSNNTISNYTIKAEEGAPCVISALLADIDVTKVDGGDNYQFTSGTNTYYVLASEVSEGKALAGTTYYTDQECTIVDKNITFSSLTANRNIEFTINIGTYSFKINLLVKANFEEKARSYNDTTQRYGQKAFDITLDELAAAFTEIDTENFKFIKRNGVDITTPATTISITPSNVSTSQVYYEYLTLGYYFNGIKVFEVPVTYSYTVYKNVNVVAHYPSPAGTELSVEYISAESSHGSGGTHSAELTDFFNSNADFASQKRIVVEEVAYAKKGTLCYTDLACGEGETALSEQVVVKKVDEDTYKFEKDSITYYVKAADVETGFIHAWRLAITSIENLTIRINNTNYDSTATGISANEENKYNIRFTLSGSFAQGSATFLVCVNEVEVEYRVIVVDGNNFTIETNAPNYTSVTDKNNQTANAETIYAEDLANQEQNLFAENRILKYAFKSGVVNGTTYYIKLENDTTHTIAMAKITADGTTNTKNIDLGRSYKGYAYKGSYSNYSENMFVGSALDDDQIYTTAPTLTKRVVAKYKNGDEIKTGIDLKAKATEDSVASTDLNIFSLGVSDFRTIKTGIITATISGTNKETGINYNIYLDSYYSISGIVESASSYTTITLNADYDSTHSATTLLTNTSLGISLTEEQMKQYGGNFTLLTYGFNDCPINYVNVGTPYYNTASCTGDPAGEVDKRVNVRKQGVNYVDIDEPTHYFKANDVASTTAITLHNYLKTVPDGDITYYTGLTPRAGVELDAGGSCGSATGADIKKNYITISGLQYNGKNYDYNISPQGANNDGNYVMMKLVYTITISAGQSIEIENDILFKVLPSSTVTFKSGYGASSYYSASTIIEDGKTITTNKTTPYTIHSDGNTQRFYFAEETEQSNDEVIKALMYKNNSNSSGAFDYEEISGPNWDADPTASGVQPGVQYNASPKSITVQNLVLGEKLFYIDATNDFDYKLRFFFTVIAETNPTISDPSSLTLTEGQSIVIGAKYQTITPTMIMVGTKQYTVFEQTNYKAKTSPEPGYENEISITNASSLSNVIIQATVNGTTVYKKYTISVPTLSAETEVTQISGGTNYQFISGADTYYVKASAVEGKAPAGTTYYSDQECTIGAGTLSEETTVEQISSGENYQFTSGADTYYVLASAVKRKAPADTPYYTNQECTKTTITIEIFETDDDNTSNTKWYENIECTGTPKAVVQNQITNFKLYVASTSNALTDVSITYGEEVISQQLTRDTTLTLPTFGSVVDNTQTITLTGLKANAISNSAGAISTDALQTYISNVQKVKVSQIEFFYGDTPIGSNPVPPYNYSSSKPLITSDGVCFYNGTGLTSGQQYSSTLNFKVPTISNGFLYGTSSTISGVTMKITLTDGTNECVVSKENVTIQRKDATKLTFENDAKVYDGAAPEVETTSGTVYNDTLEVELAPGASTTFVLTTKGDSDTFVSSEFMTLTNTESYTLTRYIGIHANMAGLTENVMSFNLFVKGSTGNVKFNYNGSTIDLDGDMSITLDGESKDITGKLNKAIEQYPHADALNLHIASVQELSASHKKNVRLFFLFEDSASTTQYQQYQDFEVSPLYTSTNYDQSILIVDNYYKLSNGDDTFYVVPLSSWATTTLNGVNTSAISAVDSYKFHFEINESLGGSAFIDENGTITTASNIDLHTEKIFVNVYMKVSGTDGLFEDENGILLATITLALNPNATPTSHPNSAGAYYLSNNLIVVPEGYIGTASGTKIADINTAIGAPSYAFSIDHTLTKDDFENMFGDYALKGTNYYTNPECSTPTTPSTLTSNTPVSKATTGDNYQFKIGEDTYYVNASDILKNSWANKNYHVVYTKLGENGTYQYTSNLNEWTFPSTGKWLINVVVTGRAGSTMYQTILNKTIYIYDANTSATEENKIAEITTSGSADLSLGGNFKEISSTDNSLVENPTVNSAGIYTKQYIDTDNGPIKTVKWFVYSGETPKTVAVSVPTSSFRVSNIVGEPGDTIYRYDKNNHTMTTVTYETFNDSANTSRIVKYIVITRNSSTLTISETKLYTITYFFTNSTTNGLTDIVEIGSDDKTGYIKGKIATRLSVDSGTITLYKIDNTGTLTTSPIVVDKEYQSYSILAMAAGTTTRYYRYTIILYGYTDELIINHTYPAANSAYLLSNLNTDVKTEVNKKLGIENTFYVSASAVSEDKVPADTIYYSDQECTTEAGTLSEETTVAQITGGDNYQFDLGKVKLPESTTYTYWTFTDGDNALTAITQEDLSETTSTHFIYFVRLQVENGGEVEIRYYKLSVTYSHS